MENNDSFLEKLKEVLTRRPSKESIIYVSIEELEKLLKHLEVAEKRNEEAKKID